MYCCILVPFRDYADGSIHQVEGIFPLSDPWWSATLLLSGGQTKHLVGCRSFKLRSDESMRSERVVWLFVEACMRDKKNECAHSEKTEAFYRALV